MLSAIIRILCFLVVGLAPRVVWLLFACFMSFISFKLFLYFVFQSPDRFLFIYPPFPFLSSFSLDSSLFFLDYLFVFFVMLQSSLCFSETWLLLLMIRVSSLFLYSARPSLLYCVCIMLFFMFLASVLLCFFCRHLYSSKQKNFHGKTSSIFYFRSLSFW